MRYELKPITQENWRAVAKLEVAPHQKGMIEDNPFSLLESAYDTQLKWMPIGLYVDNRLVGFAMIGGEDASDHSIWFDRFMIDQNQQKQGYGHALFRSVLTYLKDRYKHIDKIYLSVHPNNEKAFPFYESFGFVLTEKTDPENDQKIMSCKINR